MKLGVLNGELGIFVVDGLGDLGALPEKRLRSQMPKGAELGDLAFFYVPDRDWIVVNSSHPFAEYYAEIISCYLELSEEGRREAVANAPTDVVKAALRILDDVIWRRRLFTRWEGLRHGIGKEAVKHDGN